MQLRIGDAKVVNTRYFRGQNVVWRRRKAADGTVFTTRERIDLTGKIVKKRAERAPENYQPVKLLMSLHATLSHREDAQAAAWALLTTVENKLLEESSDANAALLSEEIAKTVLRTLKAYDIDAYITYARHHPELVSKEQLREVIS